MALPVILVNSATGSDTAASGAGPGTALTGSDGSTSGDGLTLTVPNQDLTNVPTDGSAVAYVEDATAGNRNFGKITGKANSGTASAQVTVSNAFGLSLSGLTYAIGGKRASIGSTTSRKLFDNNSAAGDAMPGWIVELESGHTETIASQFNLRRSGDLTSGPITLRGASGAATVPILTFNFDGTGLHQQSSNNIAIKDLTLLNSNGSKTASGAIDATSGNYSVYSNLTIGDASNRFWRSVNLGNRCTIVASRIDSHQHAIMTGGPSAAIIGCHLSTNTAAPVIQTAGGLVYANVIVSGGTDGVYHGTSNSPGGSSPLYMLHNTINGISSDGLFIDASGNGDWGNVIINNLLTSNGAYGINHSRNLVGIEGSGQFIDYNGTYNNTSGATNVSGLNPNGPTANPNFVSSTDFTPQEATLEGTAFPTSLNAISSFGWPGAIQPEDAGAGVPLSGGTTVITRRRRFSRRVA